MQKAWAVVQFLLGVSLIAFNNACNDEVDCNQLGELAIQSDVAYLFVPRLAVTDPNTDRSDICSNPANLIDVLQCQAEGQVLVVANHRNDRPQIEVLAADQADDHMIQNGMLASGGGSHDDAIPHVYGHTSTMHSAALANSNIVTLKKGTQPGPNGCGIFATAVCDRILGLETDKEISQKNWDDTYTAVGSFNGITPFSYIASYYQQLGFCSETRPLLGYCNEYQEMKKKLDAGCDVKLFFARKSSAWYLPSAIPHIETVIEVEAPADKGICSLQTNSWGNRAKVSGGWCTDFSHQFNKKYNGGKDAWPPKDTRVWVQTTCKCDNMESLLNYLDDFAGTPQTQTPLPSYSNLFNHCPAY